MWNREIKHQNSYLASNHLFFVLSSSLCGGLFTMWGAGQFFPHHGFQVLCLVHCVRRQDISGSEHLLSLHVQLILCCTRAIVWSTISWESWGTEHRLPSHNVGCYGPADEIPFLWSLLPPLLHLCWFQQDNTEQHAREQRGRKSTAHV